MKEKREGFPSKGIPDYECLFLVSEKKVWEKHEFTKKNFLSL